MRKISRRDFIRKGTLASASLGLFGAGIKGWATHTDYVPAIVIGSGYGGAVAALRLAEAGVDTLVLERGMRWPIREDGDTFSTFDNIDGRAAWLRDSISIFSGVGEPSPIDVFTGLMEISAEKERNGIEVRSWAGVGGGSLGHNGLMPQPRREGFERVFPRAVDYDEMDQVYYPRVRDVIRPEPIPDDVLATEFYKSKRLNFEQVERAGFSMREIPLDIDWDVVRQEIAGTRRPSAIDGQSWFGLNSGAKKSLDKNYLALAEESGYAQILPLHDVYGVYDLDPYPYFGVVVNEIDRQGEVIGVRYFVCRHLFLGAGSMGTSNLLVRARAHGTLPRLNKWIGRRWAGNGDFVLVRVGTEPTNVGQGGPGGQFIAEDLTNPYGPTGFTELVFPKSVAQDPMFGGAFVYIAMGYAPPIGRFRYDRATDSAVLSWDYENERLGQFLKSTEHTAGTFDQGNPGTVTAVRDPRSTGHPLGGATMGLACDFFGRVEGYRGLYVVDGAFIPGSAGMVNPALTIAAFAERSMEHVIENDVYG